MPLVHKLRARIALINLLSESSSSLFEKCCSEVTKHSWARPGLYVKQGDPGPSTAYDYDADGKKRALELLLSWLHDDRRILYFWWNIGVFGKDWKPKFEEPDSAGGLGP